MKTSSLYLLKLTSVIAINFILFIAVPTIVSATDYYISPTGNDTNSGISTSSPIATFTKAWSILKPGDTLFLMDGTYYQTLAPSIDGAPNPAINMNDIQTYPLDHPERIKNYIKVKALNDGRAIIDGQNQRHTVSLGWEGTGFWNKGHYFLIEGLVGKNSIGMVYYVANAKNVILRRNSGYNANTHQNSHVFTVYSGGSETTPSNILLEDNVAAGTGRKMFLAFVTYHNVVFRRNFAAWQAWQGDEWCGSPWPQTDGIEIYPARNGDQPNIPNNAYMENNINFGLTAHTGIGFSPNTGKRYGNHIMGNIALGSGRRWNNITKTFETKMADGSPLIDISGTNCRINTSPMPATCVTWGSSCQLSQDRKMDGLVIGPFESPYFENNEFKHNFAAFNAGSGLSAGPWASTSFNNYFHFNTLINNGLGDPVPKQNGALAPMYDTSTFYLQQFSSLSNLNIGKIWNSFSSTQPAPNPAPGPGANLQYRYIMGKLTNESLWPWPMEERIKREFADPSLFQADGVQGRVWSNFSVTQTVCENILKSNGAVTNCNLTNTSPTPTPTPAKTALIGDINGDNIVNILDFTILSNTFGTNNSSSDLNKDGVVNIQDYIILNNNFGKSQ